MKRKLLWGGGALCSLVILVLFVWGPLVPYSPVILGFRHQDTQRARLYFHKGTDLSPFNDVDKIIEDVETWHHMKFKERVGIFVCASDSEHRRIAFTGARFCALPGYGRLSISKRAQEDAAAGKIHLNVYLQHELSHCLLFQNMPLYRFRTFPDWMLEGLAVYSADQRGVDGYLTRDEVREQVRQGHFFHPSDFTTKPWHKATVLKNFDMPNKYWFIYSELATLVEDLRTNQGDEKFFAFIQGLLEGKDEHSLFQTIYGQPFNAYVDDFRKRMTNTNNPA